MLLTVFLLYLTSRIIILTGCFKKLKSDFWKTGQVIYSPIMQINQLYVFIFKSQFFKFHLIFNFLACLSPEKVKEPQFKILRMFWMATCAGAQATGPFLMPLNLLQMLTIQSQILKT